MLLPKGGFSTARIALLHTFASTALHIPCMSKTPDAAKNCCCPVLWFVSNDPNRKTQYDLVAVLKEGLGWVNIDSQAPNQVVKEWLETQRFDFIKPEYTYGNSRVDFYMDRGDQKYLLEVKGCTLEIDGIGYFPDAPTVRGVKHLRELTQAQSAGYQCAVAFVIQMPGITEVRPNITTQPEFGAAWDDAVKAGVKILFLPCSIDRDTLSISTDALAF